MWGGAVMVAAVVAGAEPYLLEVSQPSPTAIATAPAVSPTATATPTPTPTPTATATATGSGQDQDQVQVQGQVEDEVQDQGKAAKALPPAPQGPPLADAAPVLVSRRVRGDGGALERLVEGSGEIVLHSVSPAGTVLSCTPVGSLYRLRVVAESEAAGGEFVELVRDETGALLRFVVQQDGEARAVTLVEPAPGG